MTKLDFYDLKTKKKFSTDKFKIEVGKAGRRRAITTAPSGMKVGRFIAKDFK